VPGSEWVLPATTIIAAIGQQVEAGAVGHGDGLKMNKWNCFEVDPATLATSLPGVFAGGDCVSGPSTLIHAMAAGLKAARSIDDWVQI
ncbi:FAD-dependent oxidoreductase, partial [Mycobacterium tuberculosis]|nr:FAD-dependent oxidoreductase [Mycobacterium tuberculosis]